ncbi:M23 family metallopeptidase [Luteibacter anthropi]|uniref:M23 family metallopeptidase n=1 Tax=Luteibacter anthropi TaxID=564369 RepID=UPI002032BA78|nr:M23 family metallopeptidase [Luteibacter anthropi]URX64489.1 M23 family metallopeptidase [Luteibacter anthropi]
MTSIYRAVSAWRIALAACVLFAGMAGATTPAPVEARIPFAPTPFRGNDGAMHLAYELHVTNFYGDTGPLVPTAIDVSDDLGHALLHLDQAGIAAAIRPSPDENQPPTIQPGKRGVLYLWLTLPEGSSPHTLKHRVAFAGPAGFVLDGITTPLSGATPIRLGPPVRGGQWLAHEGPGNAHSHHWGSLVAVNGSLTVPQRYALDLVGIDKKGRAFRPVKDIHATRHSDWYGYGAPVLAVADATVVAMRDGQDEHAPLEAQPEPASLSLDGLFGNYVVLDLGQGRYAGYAHLEKGSVKVKTGQHVARGDVIGALGQSGNSAAPHLHFQVADAMAFEGSEGIPYVFEALDSFGPESEGQLFGMGDPWKPAPVRHSKNELPLNDTVVSFPTPVDCRSAPCARPIIATIINPSH